MESSGKSDMPMVDVPVARLRRLARPGVRLVAIDLDGTLLDSTKRVSDRTRETIAAARAKGTKIVIASARPPRSVRAIYRQLGLDSLQINYNGAMVWDEPKSRTVFHCPIKGSVALRMIEMARDLFEEVCVTCEVLDRWHTDREDQPYTTETGKLFRPDVIAPFEETCAQDVTKLMFLGDPRTMSRLEAALLGEFGQQVTILHTDRDLLQIMDRRVSKGVTLKKVAGHYGVQMAEVMAIGDAPNDVGMLKVAGVAVAMDNAHALVKDVAHFVAPSNDDHGVSAAIEKYVLSAG